LNSPQPLDYQVRGCWSLSQAATEAKTVSKFKNAIQLIWSALPEKAINSAVKAHCKRLQACVPVNGGRFEN